MRRCPSRISRRDLMSSAMVLLGVPPAHAYSFAAHTTVAKPATLPEPVKTRWSAAAVQKLRGRQEEAYTRLGEQLGMKTDPITVYRYLTTDRMPASKISPEEFEKTFGTRGNYEEVYKEYLSKYGHVQL